jgi:hypothetical protein
MQVFGGRFYGGSEVQNSTDDESHILKGEHNNNPLEDITFSYSTPLKQSSSANGNQIVTNREYDYRLTIPRDGVTSNTIQNDLQTMWGNRMRGKTMRCVIDSSSNDPNLSIQYITTKFRMSWS